MYNKIHLVIYIYLMIGFVLKLKSKEKHVFVKDYVRKRSKVSLNLQSDDGSA